MIGVDRRQASSASWQTIRRLRIVQFDASHERSRLNFRWCYRLAADPCLAARDGLKRCLDAPCKNLTRKRLERQVDRLARRNLAAIVLRNFRADGGFRDR
jgi:hypothetical protein